MGSNAAENHPISFKWIMKAMEKGAKLISVDPRYTRTSSKSDIYAPIRSGTDIVFLNEKDVKNDPLAWNCLNANKYSKSEQS